MAELKTQKNDASVAQFIDQVEDPVKKADSKIIAKMMEEVTGDKGSMWGDSIIGYGNYQYKYASGREGEWFVAGFSPRKQNISIYVMSGANKHPEILDSLGKFKTGKACLYIKKLADVDQKVLKKLIVASVDYLRNLKT